MIKSLISFSFLMLFALAPGGEAIAGPYKVYSPEKWELSVSFRSFPHEITCRKKTGKGRLRQISTGRTVAYKLTGFPGPTSLQCELVGKGPFEFDLVDLFSIGREKRTFWKPYLEGEAYKIDLKFVFQRNAGGYESYKAHMFARTSRERDKIIFGHDELFDLMFSERSKPVGRWKS